MVDTLKRRADNDFNTENETFFVSKMYNIYIEMIQFVSSF